MGKISTYLPKLAGVQLVSKRNNTETGREGHILCMLW